MIKLREIVIIHELKNQGLGVSEIARRTGLDRKTVRSAAQCVGVAQHVPTVDLVVNEV